MRVMSAWGTLFVVGTPIGNLEDLTDRARRVLSEVDLVAAEDSRRAGLLLKRIGARARFLSFFEANERERIPKVLQELQAGRSVALVTDAGMPGVSDPGYRLVAACAEAGLTVDVVPGPSAVVTALVASGLPTDRFSFEGFLPRAGRARQTRLAEIAADPRTVVLFESPRRTARTLADLLQACGDRRAALCRELTKVHQEVRRGSLSELAASADGEELKGEVTLVVEGAPEGGASASLDDAVSLARSLTADGMRKRDAAREAAARTGVSANRIYESLSGGGDTGRSEPRP
jgi:16S rRNA (cytidine1402-2'-O)-methyltransferase